MPTLSSQKLRCTLGVAAVLCVSLASSNLYTQAQHQQQTEQNLATTQSENSDLSSIQLAQLSPQFTRTFSTIWQNPFNARQIVNQNTKPPASENLVASIPVTYPVIDEWKNFKFSVQGKQILSQGKLPTSNLSFNQADLLTVLTNTRKYYQDYSSENPDILRPGLLSTQGVTIEDVVRTLDFMITVLREDIANKRPTRLQNPDFINNNFRVIKWSAYNPSNTRQKQIRLTKYAVFTHSGSRTRTATFNTPIYSLKDDNIADKFYTRYTKQDVLSGIYEPGGKEHGRVKPLAYLTREGLEEALMQGTILINFPDGTKGFFNVDRNNGISYVRGLKATAQKRYWYFREVDGIKGYGHNIDAKISVKPGVTFAGDILNIGLGRVVVIEHNTGGRRNLQMGVIADTGGAFLPNLYQLDYLAGTFRNRPEFNRYIRQLPEYANAYFLVKK